MTRSDCIRRFLVLIALTLTISPLSNATPPILNDPTEKPTFLLASGPWNTNKNVSFALFSYDPSSAFGKARGRADLMIVLFNNAGTPSDARVRLYVNGQTYSKMIGIGEASGAITILFDPEARLTIEVRLESGEAASGIFQVYIVI